MEILVLTQQYPSEDNFYRNMFVHDRVQQYTKYDESNKFDVFVPSMKTKKYNFEGVTVTEGNEFLLRSILKKNKYDCIIIHFLTHRMVGSLLKYSNSIPKYIWVHGYEALSWKRRKFNSVDPNFLKYILGNMWQLRSFGKYLDKSENSTFVFVSDWMKQVAEEDMRRNIKNSVIIPNAIDTEFFCASDKDVRLRKKILLIRPFNSRKYATDIAVGSLEKLSLQQDFKDFEITIAGEGKYFEQDTQNIAVHPNVTLINRFLSKKEIKQLHEKNGVFLCPTRQDAQGVSMCEAMSSGLVPITSNNTAIPEFVTHNKSGFLTNDADEIVEVINKLSKEPELFEKISKNAAKSIYEKCNSREISKQELQLIMK